MKNVELLKRQLKLILEKQINLYDFQSDPFVTHCVILNCIKETDIPSCRSFDDIKTVAGKRVFPFTKHNHPYYPEAFRRTDDYKEKSSS